MAHQHIYNEKGEQICCAQEDKVNVQADRLIKKEHAVHDHSHDHDHLHDHEEGVSLVRMFLPALAALVILLTGISLDHWIPQTWFTGSVRIIWYVVAYIPVGIPVIRDAVHSIIKGDIFSEFFLMTIATVGAFAIGEYPEGVAVMLFYSVGEVFQTMAISRARNNIRNLLDQRPDEVTIIRDGSPQTIKASTAGIGDIVQLKPGEKLALDGTLLSLSAAFNTAALTGESKPDTRGRGDRVLAGMINLNTVAEVEVTAAYKDSKLSRILYMVQHATAQKAPTELFIRRFAKIYTPIVVLLALCISFLPFFFIADYQFREWLYRALIFLVISCPCALVISIPLGYFGGIGAGSRNGILFKGGNFLDQLAAIRHVVMDKTGTLTAGVFRVQEVVFRSHFDKKEIMNMVNAVESQSTHPVATAIHDYAGPVDRGQVVEYTEEVPGQGLKSRINGKELLVGNFKLMDNSAIPYDTDIADMVDTAIAVAYDGQFVGYITISDSIKEDAGAAIEQLHELGVRTTMLSGDKSAVVHKVARQLGVQVAYGDLLPEAKVNKVKEIKARAESVAFAGDGVNDAPVVALSDVGIAMGGLGSDATIETADVVIQDDSPSRIPMAIRIGKQTRRVVIQNIILAFSVKIIVLILGAGGLATMWEAVFADVGVALLAILNAVRIQRMKF